ncbi:MAG: NAD(P)H-dependent oxidoreductase [Kangiellaceae bacterium]|nr:NAD(P)H-dependent oxidoreductase [Kangiellaceae bacterium]
MNTAVIIGSARRNGNTEKLSCALSSRIPAALFNLNNYKINPFSYQFDHCGDDFLKLIEQLVEFDRIIFATPVYWYSASSIMKNFIDRFTDLVKVHKELGRQLKGKTVALISTGCDEQPAPCFEDSFKMTYAYLGMNYQGMLYCCVEDGIDIDAHKEQLNQFVVTLSDQ